MPTRLSLALLPCLVACLAACRHARDPLDDMGGIDDPRPAAAPRASAEAPARRPAATRPPPVSEPDDDEGAEPALDPDSIPSIRQRVADVAVRRKRQPDGPPVDIARGRTPPEWTQRALWHLTDGKAGYRLAAGSARHNANLRLSFLAADANAREQLAAAANPASEVALDDGSVTRTVEATLSGVFVIDAYLDEGSGRIFVLLVTKVPAEQAADATIRPASP
jgi:hypothetical protein